MYDNQEKKSAIVLQVIVEGEQSSGKSFARYIMRTLMKPFIERDSEMRAKEQGVCCPEATPGKKDGKLPPEPKTDITILPETVSLTMFIKRCDAAVKLYGAPKTLFEFADEISAIAFCQAPVCRPLAGYQDGLRSGQRIWSGFHERIQL